MDDKALHDTLACPDTCECIGNGVKCNGASKLTLPKLPASLRLLIIRNTQLALDDVTWKGHMVALLHLELISCNISLVKQGHFKAVPFLQHLTLRNNLMSILPAGVFAPLFVVQDLDLSINLISKLHPGIFKGADNIQILRLDSNMLFMAPCTFQELTHLRVLNMSNNYLAHLADNVFCPHLQSDLTVLDISGNNIQRIDKTILTRLQNLTHLDITPLQICCLLPMIDRCCPKERFYLSTCTNLLGYGGFRYAFLLAGIFVFCVSTCSVIWICREIRGLGGRKGLTNKNLNNIMNIVLFICHSFKGLHMITLAFVDVVFQGSYALYEEMWRRHPLCVLLNMISYTCLLGSGFIFLLNAYMRMVAIVYPFKLASVSVSRPMWAIACFLTSSLIVSYFPFSDIPSLRINELDMALGFGLVLPVVRHGYQMTMLCLSSTFQIACMCVLIKNSQQRKDLQTSTPGQGPVAHCFVALVLHICCHMPLVCLHIVNASGIDFQPHIAVAAILPSSIFPWVMLIKLTWQCIWW